MVLVLNEESTRAPLPRWRPRLEVKRRFKKFTPEVLAMIPVWVKQNWTVKQIAARIDTTPGSLKVRASQLGISLTPPDFLPELKLPRQVRAGLMGEAEKLDCNVYQLVARLLTVIVEDDMWAAMDIEDDIPGEKPSAAG